MELHRITMDPVEAKRAYKSHAGATTGVLKGEDAEVLAGYKALAQGHELISLSETIRTAGVDEMGLPRLAIGRADARWIYTHGVMLDGSVTFRMDKVAQDRDGSRRVQLPAGTLPPPRRITWDTYTAMVPMTPLPLRPRGIRLSSCHVLWEANWRLVVPEDPALLRHVAGDLYAVVAVWDLTELERTVLSGRLHQPRG